MGLRVPVIAGLQPEWNRKVANALGRLQNDSTRAFPVTYAASFTQNANEEFVIVDNAGGTTTITMATPSTHRGHQLLIKTTQAQLVVASTAIVTPLIGGAAGTAILAATAGKWARLVCDGTTWVIMAAG